MIRIISFGYFANYFNYLMDQLEISFQIFLIVKIKYKRKDLMNMIDLIRNYKEIGNIVLSSFDFPTESENDLKERNKQRAKIAALNQIKQNQMKISKHMFSKKDL